MSETETAPSGVFYSRDFALLAGSMLCMLLLLAGWVVFDANRDYKTQNLTLLETEATRLDRAVILELKQSSYLLESLGRQILHLGAQDKDGIARLLRSFDTESSMFRLFAWIDADQRIVASSARGVLSKGLDVSDRDYMKKALVEPWKVQLGRPVEGRVSDKWVIPTAMGIDDYSGNHLGTVLLSIDIEKITQKLRRTLQGKVVDFAMVTNTYIGITESSEETDFINQFFPIDLLRVIDFDAKPQGEMAAVTKGNLVTYYQQSAIYPFTFLLGVNLNKRWVDFAGMLWQRMVPIFMITIFLLFVLWVVRGRILVPLHQLTDKVQGLIRGEAITADIEALDEIVYLDKQLVRINGYLQERRNIEREQRGKIAFMKQAKEAAELSNRVKIDFLHSMSHELRTPLNTIAGFAELMKNQVYGVIENEKYTQYIDDIYDCSSAVQGLVGDVLALAKAEAGMLELQEKPVQVEFVISKCIRVLSDRLKESGITIENRVGDMLPRLLVDELRLKQIILNLLGNAISHAPKGGSVIIDAQIGRDSKEERYFEIIVTDFGAKTVKKMVPEGNTIQQEMDEEGNPKLQSRSQLGRISNLGIPLTKALVAMHQANLTIESQPGKPTLVMVRFPAKRIVT
ncbi:MAG: histidine kinase dimerization/phospho-acceptor domain-containing protein [Rickettsiales bacterium]|nr:histidine kinase dimerization/phospho-acceptor domain-containing protein [Rickettsiales bacterium]